MSGRRKFPKVCEVCSRAYLAFRETQRTCQARCRATLQHREAPERLHGLFAQMAEARRRPCATVEEARAQRLARERRQGHRTFTLDAWEQRPGAGEINANADPHGWGFA